MRSDPEKATPSPPCPKVPDERERERRRVVSASFDSEQLCWFHASGDTLTSPLSFSSGFDYIYSKEGRETLFGTGQTPRRSHGRKVARVNKDYNARTIMVAQIFGYKKRQKIFVCH